MSASLARRLLLVEDEPSLALTVGDRLRAEGYEVEVAGDGERGLELALSDSFDLIVLDVMLPGRDGFEVCREIRRRDLGLPILMLTARSQVVDKVVGLKLGADDYLTKPFEMAELMARIDALLRRAGGAPASGGSSFRFGDVEVDLHRGEVRRGGRPVELTALEFKLLTYFIRERGRVLSRDLLLDEVWGYDSTAYSRTVDVHVAGLRQKLEERPSRPRHILTLRGRGYKFSVDRG